MDSEIGTIFIDAYGNRTKYDNILSRRPDLLHNLEVSAREVKCRKPCKCSFCHRQIEASEIALKKDQKTNRVYSGFYRTTYCSDCYTKTIDRDS